jgi:hypothetical protein
MITLTCIAKPNKYFRFLFEAHISISDKDEEIINIHFSIIFLLLLLLLQSRSLMAFTRFLVPHNCLELAIQCYNKLVHNPKIVDLEA